MSSPSKDSSISNVARLNMKPPQFYRKSPELWFRQLESQFVLAGLTSPVTQFHHIMAALPEDVMCHIDFDSVADYAALKSAVLDSMKANRHQLIEEAMAAIELGDRKPSQLVHEIRRRFAEIGVKVDDSIVKARLLRALPPSLRAALVGHEDVDVNTYAKIADSIVAVSMPASYAVNHLKESKWPADNNARRHPSPANQIRPFYSDQRPKVCRSHIYYGARARTCRPWCQWPGQKPKILQSGERTPTHSRPSSPSAPSPNE